MSAGHCDPRKIVKRIYKQIKHPELPPKHHIPFIFSLLQLSLPGLCNSSPVPTIYTGHPRTLSSDYRGFLRDGASYRGEEAAGRDSRTPAAFRYPSDEWQTDTQTPELVLAVMTANYTLALSFQIVFLLMATKRRRSHPTSAKSLVKDTVSHPGRQLSNEIHSTSARPRFRKSQ